MFTIRHRQKGQKMKTKDYRPMECPVCGKFYFSELQEDDDVSFLQCSKCGWIYDYEQTINPDFRHGKNVQSVNEYRKRYKEKIAENPEYDYSEEHLPPIEPHQCPVCGMYSFKDKNSFDACPVCGWIDDGLMEDEPDCWEGNSNDLCLNDFRKRYLQGK